MLPVNKQRDGILRSLHAAKILCYTFPCTGRYPLGHPALPSYHALAHIHVVAIEVVADIAVLASPSLERLELGFRLRHVAVEIVEVTK